MSVPDVLITFDSAKTWKITKHEAGTFAEFPCDRCGKPSCCLITRLGHDTHVAYCSRACGFGIVDEGDGDSFEGAV